LQFHTAMSKVCTKCNKERESFQFSPRKNKTKYPDGRDYHCLICRAEIGTHKKKYRQLDPRILIKVRESDKFYFTESETLYIKLRIGFKRVKSDIVTINRKQVRVEKLRHKYFEIA
jgi:DNA-directed RNA polymerase subunit RPC12/RpoP